MKNSVHIVSSNQIDPLKWNDCINKSSNALLYADYRILSALCDNWSGLIVGDYESVLPLPWRKKFGIKYLYAPAFIQQLGFFGNLSSLDMKAIWKSVFGFAKFGDLYFNYENKELLNNIDFIEKTNFILNLNNPYPLIRLEYTHDLKKNLQKNQKQILNYSNDLSIEDSIHLFQSQYQHRFPQYQDAIFKRFIGLCKELSHSNNCITRTAFTENEILSSAVLLKNNNRMILIMNATTHKGRTLAANHFLLDQIIQEFSEENLIFDFEGSELKGIKEFYQSFRPVNQTYFQVSYNHFPTWINWIRTFFFR